MTGRASHCFCTIFALTVLSCGASDTSGLPVSVDMRVEPIVQGDHSLTDFVLDSGWSVHLDEARVVLGPVYLRAPRRTAMSFWRALLPRVHAHSGHAQTLTEGQVLGEFLRPVAIDALSEEPIRLGSVAVEAGRLERLSVVLSPAGSRGDAHGQTAFIRGWADRDAERVEFECGLAIEQDTDETPENLEARRRIDQITLHHAPQVREGDTLVLEIHPWRWLERVDFDALVGLNDPCPSAQSAFVLQWYLGIRRPEAFGATLISKE